MEIITSRQNPRIKEACALCDKKARRRSGSFRFDGVKLFCDCLGKVEIDSVFVREPRSEFVERSLKKAFEGGSIDEKNVIYVSESVFEKLSEEASPEGIITVARMPKSLHVAWNGEDFKGEEKLLIVESLRDAGNLGTVIRSSAALGIDTLIISDDCAELYNPKTVRSAMGALFRMPVVTVEREDMVRLVKKLRSSGRAVYAAALREDALTVGEFELKRGDCFVIGNEGHGISPEISALCDESVYIPISNKTESLNASVAAAIFMWEQSK